MQARLTWTGRERKPGPLIPGIMTFLRLRHTTCLLRSRYRLGRKMLSNPAKSSTEATAEPNHSHQTLDVLHLPSL